MNEIDSLEVKNYLPHRYPFLLVDKVIDFVEGQSLIAIKNVTHNEPFFAGHFPAFPVMPGVLIIEAMAQASGILMYRTFGRYPTGNQDLFFLASIDEARFKRKVVPGDQLQLSIEVIRRRENAWKFKGTATVDGELTCTAEFMNIKAENNDASGN
ncbi:MAG: 3-hydroxyacyl-[acyl-carrier-protein] dehydratase FabZ [Gammaproteobacteria bacterium RIFCSPLOWO2_02_FULL_42_14]|nr:MAG: 3-hydroxyacyl-[acyl-carrier-protein] dehydratase FabZ [Gammaproteobacteria bacterium RIFCSPHIGHO2_02_FULL_42_43]OGT27435.1 MAG: 3-hydroxyacyl-[acyl-carrier-protein] dehydratase FabZ [Gammaproteobacteria bacterium RIFCSPHIGHO2_01_FULL_42_8]OGT52355.1 MAG: 3-hydroxyacyl-[acyl-carrier-protein] dehydratase FabZ [Gammaproteobacteria bacterium RIFCSPHIGHO2_12_FULL_41_25]OGT63355.1 MAG: 3-hydroxyacyl-[acyl-carrier-protein] dehydratase FabZ [Gammaproteobacteria bacterium RIFCSPLOWO2_02_FULL_42_1